MPVWVKREKRGDWARPCLDAGVVPLPGDETGELVIDEAEWVAMSWEDQQELNALRPHTNFEISREVHPAVHGVRYRWRYTTPVITSL